VEKEMERVLCSFINRDVISICQEYARDALVRVFLHAELKQDVQTVDSDGEEENRPLGLGWNVNHKRITPLWLTFQRRPWSPGPFLQSDPRKQWRWVYGQPIDHHLDYRRFDPDQHRAKLSASVIVLGDWSSQRRAKFAESEAHSTPAKRALGAFCLNEECAVCARSGSKRRRLSYTTSQTYAWTESLQ
jgi:hypothetical protein